MGLHDGRGKYTLFQKCWDPYGDEFTTGHVLKLLSPNIGASICCLFEICLEFTKLVFFFAFTIQKKEERILMLLFFYQVSQTSAKMCHLDGREPVVEV